MKIKKKQMQYTAKWNLIWSKWTIIRYSKLLESSDNITYAVYKKPVYMWFFSSKNDIIHVDSEYMRTRHKIS